MQKYSAGSCGQVTDRKIFIVFRPLACSRFSHKKSPCLPNRVTKKQDGARFRLDPCLWPANLADLPNPLHKSRDALSADLLREHDIAAAFGGLRVRAFDSTTARGPDRTGSLWRLHYGVSLPSLCCDLFNLAAAAWGGGRESITQFPIRPGDYVLADRDHSTAVRIRHVILVGCQADRAREPGPAPPASNDGSSADGCRTDGP